MSSVIEKSRPGNRVRRLLSAVGSPVSRNISSSALNTAVNAAAGLITLPLLIHQLGAESYGLWVLIVSTTGLFTMMDLGLTAGVGRRVAAQVHGQQADVINDTLSSALAMLVVLAVATLVLTVLTAALFPFAFEIPAAKLQDVMTALLISGIGSAVYFPAAVYDAVLWGRERFDLHNAVEIPTVLVRLFAIMLLVRPTTTLTELALIVVLPAIAGYAVRTAIVYRMQPGLRIRPSGIRKSILFDLLSFGQWFGVLTFSRAALQQVTTLIVGHSLGPSAVTVFTIPRVLVSYANWMAAAITQVIAPRFAALQSANENEGQRTLFMVASRIAMVFAVFTAGGLAVCGMPFLSVWQPGAAEPAYVLLLILAAGELFALSQWVGYNLAISTGRHAVLARLGLAELLFVGITCYIASRFAGLVGVAVCAALGSAMFRGFLTATAAARMAGIRPRSYLEDLARVVAGAAVPVATTFVIVTAWQPHDALAAFTYSTVVYVASFGIFIAIAANWLTGRIASQQALHC